MQTILLLKMLTSLTLMSNTLARKCNWEIWEESSIGNDHYPVVTKGGEGYHHREGEGGCLKRQTGISFRKSATKD